MDYSADFSTDLAHMSPGMIILWLAVTIIMIIAEWKIYTKAGKPGWAVLIPIYNVIVLLDIVGRPWWWILLLLIPFVNLIIMIILMNDISKSFGHGVGFTLGLIFLGPIFVLILGFEKSNYVGPAAAKA